MVVERIAARPVDHPYIRVSFLAAVELVLLSRMQQQVGDARNRNGGLGGIYRQRHLRRRHLDARTPDAVGGAVPESKSSARKSDATQHGGERDRRPERLLAVMRALQ